MESKNSGMVPFVCIAAIAIFLFIVCVICPLAISGFSKEPYALPLMGLGLALPFVHFFIFGGIQLARDKKEK